MAAYRCSTCSHYWPLEKEYKMCPECLEPCSTFRNATPMEDDEARSLKLHFDFDRYYEEREERLGPLEEREEQHA